MLKKSRRRNTDEEITFFSPLSDWGFKRLFGTEANKGLLRYLLNTIIQDRRIVELTLLNSEHEYLEVENGRSIFDIYCKCEDGSRIIVECQRADEGNFLDRAFAYSSMAVMDQAQEAWDYRLDRLYFIAFATFNLFRDSTKYLTRAQIMDLETPGRVLYDNYLQIFVETSKFVSDDNELNSAMDELLYVLKNLDRMDRIPDWVEERDDELTQICNTAKFGQLSDKDKEEYMDAKERERSYQRSIELAAKTGREEGLAEGLDQGHAEGLEEGINLGREEGLAEGRESALSEVEKRLRELGVSSEIIRSAIGKEEKKTTSESD